tara:strand:+ start:1569 stop:1739 length:171 start_codon:yes stop_codon:yes gene_type:complete
MIFKLDKFPHLSDITLASQSTQRATQRRELKNRDTEKTTETSFLAIEVTATFFYPG